MFSSLFKERKPILRLSIIAGIILSTLNSHSLKAFDESDDAQTSLITVTALFKPSETVSLDSLRDKLTSTGRMSPNGVGFLININGILVEVARLYPKGLEIHKDWLDQKEEEERSRKKSICKRAFQRALAEIGQLVGLKF